MKKVTLKDLIKHITTGHLDSIGGYPFDHEWIGDTLAVAEVIDGSCESRLATYTREHLETWIEEANLVISKEMAMPENERLDRETIIAETQP